MLAGLVAYLIIARNADETIVIWITIGAPLLLLIPIAQTVWYAKRLP